MREYYIEYLLIKVETQISISNKNINKKNKSVI
jgi:hypothetical protein